MSIKLLTIGDSGVGKTCLLLRFVSGSFFTDDGSNGALFARTTIGVDYKSKHLVLDGVGTKLQVWDTAGQERFRTITTSYYRGAHGILLVYDVGDRSSFESIRGWIKHTDKHADVKVCKLLMGNKSDLLARGSQNLPPGHVTTEEGKRLAEEFGIPFIEASAKSDINVEEGFVLLARLVKKRLDDDKLAKEMAAAGLSPIKLQGKKDDGEAEEGAGGAGGCC